MTDILSIEAMSAYLNPQISPYIYTSLASTNDTAKQLQNPAHGTVIIADYQTAGRGRYGRKFFSPPGCGIYMSMVLSGGSYTHSLVTPMAAVAVCEAIEATTDMMLQIKWVNDIFLNGRKICGILTEAVSNENGSYTIIGIGINFIPPPDGFPVEIEKTAGALFDGKNSASITRNQLVAEIANRLLVNKTNETLLLAYKKRLMVLKKRVLVTAPDVDYEALVLDLSPDGGLVVQKDDGEVTTITSGEINLTWMF